MSPTAQLLVWIAVISGALGTLFPPIIAVIQQEHWGARTKVTVTLILDGTAAVITVVGKGDWQGWTSTSFGLLASSFIAYFAMSGLTYDKVWKTFNIAPWIERVTTLKVLWTALVSLLPSTRQARIRDLESQLAALKAQLDAPPESGQGTPVAEISS